MKLKAALFTIAGLIAGWSMASAATLAVNNVVAGPGDTLYADENNVPLNGGIVTMGYFPAGVTPMNLTELQAALGDFTVVTSAVPGSPSLSLGGSFPGYAEATAVDIGTVTGANALLGRPIYSIIGNGADLGSSTAWAMVEIDVFKDDDPFAFDYTSNPAGLTPVVGGTDSVVGNFAGFGSPSDVFSTVTLEIPEPGAIALGLIGFLGLLRRRR